MKKFIFSLQALLNLKESLEKQEKNSLMVLTRKLNALQAERDSLLDRRESANTLYSAKLAGGMLAAETHQFTGYFRMVKELLAEQNIKIAQAQAEVEACQKKLVEVMREIHMLESLKDKQYQQYLQEAQIEQDKVIGDFVSYQSTHKPDGGIAGIKNHE
jgi:flagellar protein FliJ